jgi:aminoglycoside phosphotransferase (APT) family kinase protein
MQAAKQAAKQPDLSAALATALARVLGPGTQVQGLRRLSGGASQETWAFDALASAGPRELILRRAPPGAATRASGNPGLAAEAQLIRLAGAAGVPVPEVVLVLQAAHGLGDGFVMQRLPGETLGRRVASAERRTLARQCGEALARIHALPVADLPPLRATQPRAEVAHLRQWHASHGAARPVFQLALRWLDEHAPADGVATLVHGDFRNGNLMVDLAVPDGVPGSALVGVLDWELAHLGDPMADLGWLCVHSWRFGQLQRPVGGFGTLDALLDGYAAAGGRADRDRLHWWQVLGSLRWGVICESMGQAWRTGAEPVMEKAAISRRASETEIDLLALLVPRPQAA